MEIPFNKPLICGGEIAYIQDAMRKSKLFGDGYYSNKCSEFIEFCFHVPKAFMTTSCTHALELATLLIDIKAGDEVIMPSYTFTSTANAVVLRRGIPVFVDIRKDTLNMDENEIEQKITPATKAIYVVHYAGVACDMDRIVKLTDQYNLYIIEDAAQAFGAKYKDQYLGAIGDIGAYSFHSTKNIQCDEGGSITIKNPKFIERAEILREKGTNRSKFLR